MLALQILQSDDRMNPHQKTSHNDYYRHEKMVRIVKMIGKKLQNKKLLGAMAIFNYILLPLVIVVFTCGIFTVSSMQIDLIPTYEHHPCFLNSAMFICITGVPKIFNEDNCVVSPPLFSEMKSVRLETY